MPDYSNIQRSIVVFIGAVSLILLFGQSNAGESPASSGLQVATGQKDALPPHITVTEAAKKREQGVFILDVRQTSEWNEYHIPDSTLIPLDQLGGRQNEVPRDREVVVVCRSGNRSGKGREILMKAGFTRVTNMQGGLLQWRADGFPAIIGK